ncbi:MAG: hypothetical protein JWN34_1531 [Bryobacterales bacterium]|nr:hypothetical protein [Bryobacterales bacterium]
MKPTTRRTAIGALLGLPVALSTRAQAQSGQMDSRVIEAVLSYGGGFYAAIKAGMNIMSLNTDEMLGMHCGLIEQLRSFGGVDDYLNLYISSPPPPVNAEQVYSYLIPHYGRQPQMQAQLHYTLDNLSYGVPGMYDALFAAGGHDGFNNRAAGVYQYYNDIQGGYSPNAQTASRAQRARPAAGRRMAAAPRPQLYGDESDYECQLFPELCYYPPIDPCAFDACYPPWGGIPGAFPWADTNDPKTPKPVHGLTKEDVCFYATKLQWYFGQIAGIYSAIIKRDAVLITLSGEIIIATPVATEVIAAVAVGLLVSTAVGQIAC